MWRFLCLVATAAGLRAPLSGYARAPLVRPAAVTTAAVESATTPFVVFPPDGAAPTRCVHFLGGVFFGAASTLTYRYLLERFAADGAVVVHREASPP